MGDFLTNEGDDRAETLTGIETTENLLFPAPGAVGDDRAETLTGIETNTIRGCVGARFSDDRAETLTGIET